MTRSEKRRQLALIQIKDDHYQGTQLAEVIKCKGMTRRQASEKLDISYYKLAKIIHYAPKFGELFVREEKQSTDAFNGVLFGGEDDEGEDLDKRNIECWTHDCSVVIENVRVSRDTPFGKEPKIICTHCRRKNHEFQGKSAGINEEDSAKIRAYDPDARGFLPGLDGPVKTIKGREFKKLAAQYLPEIQAESKTEKARKKIFRVPKNNYKKGGNDV